MKKRGRPTKLNDEITNQIVEFIEQGCDQKTACNLAGIPYSCYNEWKAKGSEGIQPFEEFFSVISRARDKHKHWLIKLILAGASGARKVDWRAASWMLSKSFPLEYGDRPLPPLPAPAEEPKAAPLVMQLLLSMPNGEQRETTFEEAEKIFCNFPRKDTYQPPAEEGNSSPTSEPDSELFDAKLDDLRSNGD
jgi:hypothetical protein